MNEPHIPTLRLTVSTTKPARHNPLQAVAGPLKNGPQRPLPSAAMLRRAGTVLEDLRTGNPLVQLLLADLANSLFDLADNS